MTKLGDLSGDSLEAIFCRLDAFSLCKLWFSGSLSMRSKLSKHVKVFEVVSTEKKTFEWPKIVKNFVRLHTFSLTISWGEAPTMVGGVDLGDLSPSLKRLELLFGNGLLSLLDFSNLVDQLDESTVVPLSSLPSKNIHALFPELQTLEWGDCFWMGEWPNQIYSQIPTLTRLALDATTSSPSDIQNLPSTLTSLSFCPQSIPTRCDTQELIVWPPHLSTLDLNSVSQCHWLKNLPSDLQKLSYILARSTCQCFKPYGFLVFFSGESSLSTINHDSNASLLRLDGLSKSSPKAAKWPPHLQELRLLFTASLPSSFFSALPRGLKVLSMRMSEEIKLESFDLPTGMQTFHLKGWQCPDDYAEIEKYVKALPRDLKCLSLNGNTRRGEKLQLEPLMHFLPKTLTTCAANISGPLEHLQEWPVNLEGILITIPEEGGFLKQAPFKFMKSVYISSATGSADGTRSILEGLSGLKHIRKLTIQRSLDAKDLALLDCELAHLSVRTPIDLNRLPITAAPRWYTSLQSLHFDHINHLSFDPNTEISFFKSLPHSLTTLNLSISTSPRVSTGYHPGPPPPPTNFFTQEFVFPNLPPNLRILVLELNSFRNEGLQYLPPSLTSIRLLTHQSHFTFSHPNNFSQSLNYFSLRVTSMPTSVSTAPPTLDQRVEQKRQFFASHPNLCTFDLPHFDSPELNPTWSYPKHGAIGRALQTYPRKTPE